MVNKSDLKVLLLFGGLIVVMAFLLALCVRPAHAQERIVFHITNFGRGMEPVMNTYRNDPEAIVLSQNFYSTYPNGRQLRFGVSLLTDTVSPSASPVQSAALFLPRYDSGAVIYTAGGNWYSNIAGARTWRTTVTPGFDWKAALSAQYKIRPLNFGDSLYLLNDSVVGFGTRFIRDLQPGDSISASGELRRVLYVVGDEKLYLTSAWASNDTVTSYTAAREYDSLARPFLLQSGDFMYSGNVLTEPQIIYTQDDTLRLRTMGIVDSFRIDAINSIYADSLNGDELRRSFYVDANDDTVINEIMLVSRRKGWQRDEWLADLDNTPFSYYVRIGWDKGADSVRSANAHRGKFFTIRGNTDTSLYLSAWYVSDSLDTGAANGYWKDVNLSGQGLTIVDTMSVNDVGTASWAYIYSAAGFHQVIADEDATGTAELFGRGAVWLVGDTSEFYIDPDTFYTGLYFLHLTADNVTFPSYDITNTRVFTYDRKAVCGNALSQDKLPLGDSIIFESEPYYLFGVCYIDYIIKGKINNITTVDARFVNESYFPIRYAEMVGDSLYFVTSAAEYNMLADASTETTDKWEIVRVGLPQWAGMAEWNNPPQLVAWGDTSSPSLLSFSGLDEPWRWTAANDVLVGNDPAEPIRGVLGYDDQLVIFKAHTMTGFDGGSFKELSITNGLVGPRAVVGLNKDLFFLDVDGVYQMSRRDFSGYTIQKISRAVDPVFNSWSTGHYSTVQVPFKINPANRGLSVLTYNQRDQHLYLFFPEGTDSSNSRCLTYNTQTGQWDGFHTIRASDAFWGTLRDTSRIFIGSPDSASMGALDYVFRDFGSHYTGILQSGKFWAQDENGRPIDMEFFRGRLVARGSGLLSDADSTLLLIRANNSMSGLTQSADSIAYITTSGVNDYETIFYSQKQNSGRYWDWRMRYFGTSTGTIFQPFSLDLEFIPVGEND